MGNGDVGDWSFAAAMGVSDVVVGWLCKLSGGAWRAYLLF